MSKTNQSFGLTKSTAYVEGEAIHFTMTETGTFAALPSDRLDYAAWDALSDDEKAALAADVRSGGFTGFYRKEGRS